MTVYFIQSDCGRIKIGYTEFSPEKRLADIRGMSPRALTLLAHVPGPQVVELALHSIFKQERLHGEWFEPSERLLRLVRYAAENSTLEDYRDPELGDGWLGGAREAS